MTPAHRKLNFAAHVTSSVGWLGAVASFLVLSIAGLTSRDVEIVRAAYLAMNVIGQFIIVPLSLVALLTGLVQSLGTHWGLFRHYWVLVKFTLTIGASFFLLLHQFTAVVFSQGTAMVAAPEETGFKRERSRDTGARQEARPLCPMNRSHCQPRFVRNDLQQGGCRSGGTTPILFPVLKCFYADADEARKLRLRELGSFANRPNTGSADYNMPSGLFLTTQNCSSLANTVQQFFKHLPFHCRIPL
jgi:hypothetical protein